MCHLREFNANVTSRDSAQMQYRQYSSDRASTITGTSEPRTAAILTLISAMSLSLSLCKVSPSRNGFAVASR